MEQRPTVVDHHVLADVAWQLAEATSGATNVFEDERGIHRYFVGLVREQARRTATGRKIRIHLGQRSRRLNALDRAVDRVLDLVTEEDLDVEALIAAIAIEARCRDEFLYGSDASEYLKRVSRTLDNKGAQRVFAEAVRRGDIQRNEGRLISRSAPQLRFAAWGIFLLTMGAMLLATFAIAHSAVWSWMTIVLHVAGSVGLAFWLVSSQFSRARKLRNALAEAVKAARLRTKPLRR